MKIFRSIKKKSGIVLMAVCVCLGLLYPGVTVQAAAGATSVGVSAGSLNIGDTVIVTAKAAGAAGERAVATMTLSYDAGILQFVSCSTTYGGGGGSVTATGDTFTVTLKAVAAGTSSISLSGSDGVVFDTNEELASMAGSSASVTVNNAAGGGNAGGESAAPGGNPGGGSAASGGSGGGGTASGGEAPSQALSADNSLKSLTISPGTLSPAFSGKTTSYSASVGNDVTSIAVSAIPVNAKAVVESVTGNGSLGVGSNAVKVVVKAENGVTATYTINVTRQSAGQSEPQDSGREDANEPESEAEVTAETLTVNGSSYQIAENFKERDIPADFVESTVSYHGNEHKGVSFQNGTLKLLWLIPDGEESAGKFFVYDETRDAFYSFVRMSHGDKYVIALLAPVDFSVPENYQQTTLAVEDGNTIAGYQQTSQESTEIASDFYLFYAVNHEGTEGWYRYDALEGTYQRADAPAAVEDASEAGVDMEYLQEEYNTLSEKYKQERMFARTVIGILAFVIVLLVVGLINLLLYRLRKRENDDFSDDDDLDDGFPGGGFRDEEDILDDDSDDSLIDEEDTLDDDSGDSLIDEEDIAREESSRKLMIRDEEHHSKETDHRGKTILSAQAEFSEEKKAAGEKGVTDQVSRKRIVPEMEDAAPQRELEMTEADEEEFCRRMARELFFAEEKPQQTVKKDGKSAKKNTRTENMPDRRGQEQADGDLEIIDFNDL